MQDGLDLTYLRALRAASSTALDGENLVARVADHLEEHAGYVAFSGGKDSAVVVDIARRADPAVPVVFFDSGLEFPETYDYILDVARHWKLNLQVHRCEPDMLSLLHRAGTWDMWASTVHQRTQMREHLISRPSARAHDEHGLGVLWGVRADESRTRRNFYGRVLARESELSCRGCCRGRDQQRARHGGISRRADTTVAYGPIWRWSTRQVWEYCAAQDIPPNPLYAKLAAMGAPEAAQRVTPIIDAIGLSAGRATWLRRGWPDLTEQLIQVLPRIREFI